jgi:hypothetical protein
MKTLPAFYFMLAFASVGKAESADTLTYDADDAPEKGKLERPAPLPEPLGMIFPDLPMTFKDDISIQSEAFSFVPGLVLLADYSDFEQDAESVEQLGVQGSAWESRAVRLIRPPHSPTPVPVLTVSSAAGAKAIS